MLSRVLPLSVVLTLFFVVVALLIVSPVDDAAVLLAVCRPQADLDNQERLPDYPAVCASRLRGS